MPIPNFRISYLRIPMLSALAVSAALLGAVGCSGSARSSVDDPQLPENTGAISAKLTSAPADVKCVVIHTSDFHVPTVLIDVTPGQSFTQRLAPLATGWLSLWGSAYDKPCDAVKEADPVAYGADSGGGYPPLQDASAPDSPTWTADTTYVNVLAGQTTPATLRFHQPGGVDINIDFDNCDNSWGNASCPGQDGGPWSGNDQDAGPFPGPDASPPQGVDAAMPW